jgi:hypothetical protein
MFTHPSPTWRPSAFSSTWFAKCPKNLDADRGVAAFQDSFSPTRLRSIYFFATFVHACLHLATRINEIIQDE